MRWPFEASTVDDPGVTASNCGRHVRLYCSSECARSGPKLKRSRCRCTRCTLLCRVTAALHCTAVLAATARMPDEASWRRLSSLSIVANNEPKSVFAFAVRNVRRGFVEESKGRDSKKDVASKHETKTNKQIQHATHSCARIRNGSSTRRQTDTRSEGGLESEETFLACPTQSSAVCSRARTSTVLVTHQSTGSKSTTPHEEDQRPDLSSCRQRSLRSGRLEPLPFGGRAQTKSVDAGGRAKQ